MSAKIVSILQAEEQSLMAELRETPLFQKLEGIRKLLALYAAGPSAAKAESAPELLPMRPEPVRPEPVRPEPAAVADAMPSPREVESQPEDSRESLKAVSSVRAALLAMKVS